MKTYQKQLSNLISIIFNFSSAFISHKFDYVPRCSSQYINFSWKITLTIFYLTFSLLPACFEWQSWVSFIISYFRMVLMLLASISFHVFQISWSFLAQIFSKGFLKAFLAAWQITFFWFITSLYLPYWLETASFDQSKSF